MQATPPVVSPYVRNAVVVHREGPAASGTTATTAPGTGAFHSNEDPTHEKGESAQREADENSGKAFTGRGPGGRFTPNEDPTHEKSESAAREAQENAGRVPSTP